MTFHTMDQIKRAVAATGSHWFDADTLAWFGSRISSVVYPVPDGALFVTSEFTGFERASRAYTVRLATDDGSVSTVGEFLQYKTRDAAHRAAKLEQKLTRQLAAI
jgi:hypothetical protein